MVKAKISEFDGMTWDDIEKAGMMDQLRKSPDFQRIFLESMNRMQKNFEDGKPTYIYGDDGKACYKMG